MTFNSQYFTPLKVFHILRESEYMSDNELLKILQENIQTKVSPQVFNAYFKDIRIKSRSDSNIILTCKNAFTKQSIESKYSNTIQKTIEKIINQNLKVEFIIDSLEKKDSSPKQNTLFSNAVTTFQKTEVNDRARRINESQLNKKYTFDTFIVWDGNQLAYAAAKAISDSPGQAYNPFFIYGDVGLGKTHLMQAIGNEILRADPDAKVFYCSTESFLNEMVASIRMKNSNDFRNKYRALDVLMIDDIQFLSNKVSLQEEFFNTFNTLYQAGKQIIIASDRPPSEISHLEERVRSRFEGGLVADIKGPNFESRIAIIEQKLQEKGEHLPTPIIHVLAEVIQSNIRELEGALLKVLIYYKTKGNITKDEVYQLFGEKLFKRREKVNPLDIMNAVCEYLEIELKDVKSSKRNADISFARQVCMYLLKDILNLQLVKIAKHVSRSDHTTIIHGIGKIEKMVASDNDTQKIIMDIKAKISS